MPLQIPIERRSTGALNKRWLKIAIIDENRCLSRKQYELCSLVLWLTSIGNHVSVPVTLSVLERRNAKGHIFFSAELGNNARTRLT